jgi:hypothetical protein
MFFCQIKLYSFLVRSGGTSYYLRAALGTCDILEPICTPAAVTDIGIYQIEVLHIVMPRGIRKSVPVFKRIDHCFLSHMS